ncbi:uncharacterized protein LOC127123684 [Lathyrus oleraceus]|uniref:uncharacterized protein LOC127123684 n=1 Tax=Pisum sativum TaxID=3888 RepID=UPI0021D0500B|nr:uncharacterized protein LOC127123684 [Pisum sativum]
MSSLKDAQEAIQTGSIDKWGRVVEITENKNRVGLGFQLGSFNAKVKVMQPFFCSGGFIHGNDQHSASIIEDSECPVYKGVIGEKKLVPLYGKGRSVIDPRTEIPPRPSDIHTLFASLEQMRLSREAIEQRFKEYIDQCIKEFCMAQEQRIALLQEAQERRFQQLECRIKVCRADADYRIKKFQAEAEQRIKECRVEADQRIRECRAEYHADAEQRIKKLRADAEQRINEFRVECHVETEQRIKECRAETEQRIKECREAQERCFQQLECRIKECRADADYRIKKFRAEAEQRIKECRAEADQRIRECRAEYHADAEQRIKKLRADA